MSKTILRNVSHEKWGEGKEGGEKEEGEQEETVAKTLHGQRSPMPHYQLDMSYSVSSMIA